ncbi:MAG: MBL fold metallo-hydrolase [Spirochaetes bacterium]|jgi:L-ascorbate metabolism protein UlaG (beta-lactamase superfamily)|nr:MBL fold metallo-hydrolase [Spirochaetota bacterium]
MNISFKWIGGATWILRVDDVKIACDPVLCPEGHVQDYKYFKTKRLNSPVYDESDFKNINLWLLTHNHEDHLDKYGFKMIDRESAVVSHKSLKPYFRDDKFKNVTYLGWNEESNFSSGGVSFSIRAVPAIHAKKKFFSGKIGNGNGYVLCIGRDDFKYNIYITGDSVFNRGIKTYFRNTDLDLIIVNAGSAMLGKSFLSSVIGRITDNIGDIIKMNAVLKPKSMIPVHWGTFSHYSEKITPGSFDKHDNIKILNAGESIVLS